MKVITGFVFYGDREQKKRPAVVFAEIDGWVAVIPLTSHFDREPVVHDGDVILSSHSTAYAGTGLGNGAKVSTLRVKDAAIYSVKSFWMREVKVIGDLDLKSDLRFRAQFEKALKDFPIVKVVDWQPVGA